MKIIYEADDGTRFTSKAAAEKYEKALSDPLVKLLADLDFGSHEDIKDFAAMIRTHWTRFVNAVRAKE